MIKQRPQLLHNIPPHFGNDRSLLVNQNQSTKIANWNYSLQQRHITKHNRCPDNNKQAKRPVRFHTFKPECSGHCETCMSLSQRVCTAQRIVAPFKHSLDIQHSWPKSCNVRRYQRKNMQIDKLFAIHQSPIVARKRYCKCFSWVW